MATSDEQRAKWFQDSIDEPVIDCPTCGTPMFERELNRHAQQAPQVRADERYLQGYRDAADECASACRYQGRETANIDVEDSSIFVYTRATEACASACERLSNKAAANPQQSTGESAAVRTQQSERVKSHEGDRTADRVAHPNPQQIAPETKERE